MLGQLLPVTQDLQRRSSWEQLWYAFWMTTV